MSTRRTREDELRARYTRSRALYERARRCIPGGIHLSGRALVDFETTPSYFERGDGARIVDVDRHEYTDYLMAFGAQLLGYAQPEVEQAAHLRGSSGNLLSLNHPLHIELIEALLPRFPGAEMGVFLKTGSEATTAALRIARQKTGRKLVARAGYHGWHDWCLPLEPFVPAGLDQQVPEFDANDPASLQRVLASHPLDFAAVILAPEMVLPHDPALFHELARITRSHGALLIMDEVKTAVRIEPGSVSARVGLVPDIITVSKALGNGWPIAATLGRREVMEVAAGMHYSATFHGETAAMAAALATLSIVDRDGVARHVDELGQRLIDGLNALVAEHSVSAVAYAEPLPAMPFFKFTEPDPQLNAELTRWFYREVLARGSLLHPRHLWFLSAAHREADVDATLETCRAALRQTLELVRAY
ncbi:MAG TPA: aminotransferase class III-fold pyridoxal phosphate-dependent enzyme [Polyangiaceae bacterium]|nr:aminotransferase class III-fold pyridoxal phosphate-dependent enzyme [Polyangiaceae bacterium]